VRNATDGVRELMLARWSMPRPPQFGGALITNIRNTASPHWRAWLNVEHRCVVPFNSFCEYADTKPRKTPTWFAFDEGRPLAFFAGVWTTWHGKRGTKANPIEGEHQLFGFLTTDQCGSGRYPSQGDAGDSRITGGREAMAETASEGGARPAKTAAGRHPEDRCDW
jgi:putative SOS response-associated peptidase YedK